MEKIPKRKGCTQPSQGTSFEGTRVSTRHDRRCTVITFAPRTASLPSETPFSLLSKQETWPESRRIASITTRNRDETPGTYLHVWWAHEKRSPVVAKVSFLCSTLACRCVVIAWRKSKLQPAAGAPLLHARSGDVSVCIVIEWYNKGWSPWETENRTTWRTRHRRRKPCYKDSPCDSDRCCNNSSRQRIPFQEKLLRTGNCFRAMR